MIHIKNILHEDAEKYWMLRLEGLKTSPESFSSSYDEAKQTPMTEVVKRIGSASDNYIVGAFTEEGKLVGMVGFKREQTMKLKHKAVIWGVYVSTAFRGQGIAKKLVMEVIKRGTDLEGLEQINLCVVSTNIPAVELYKKLGFEIYGTEKNALQYMGHKYDEELMVYCYS